MIRAAVSLLIIASLIASSCGSDHADSSTDIANTGSADLTVTTDVETTEPVATDPPDTVPAADPPPFETAPLEISSVSVVLPDYPIFETSVITTDQELLDTFASEYTAGLDGGEAQMERFLFGTLPVQVFDEIFAGDAPAQAPELMWAMYLSGWFGGRWLRGEITAAQPDAPLAGFSLPPDNAAFQASMAKAQVALDVLNADDSTALEYASSSLAGFPNPEGVIEGGLADNFGYNVGYMLQILEAPPEGLTASPQFDVACDGLLSCTYATPKLAVLEALKAVAGALNAPNPDYEELAAIIAPIQEAAIPRGRSVWSSGLSVEGFPQEEYDQLLDVSSSFLETVQATALTMAEATVTDDADIARTGALAHAAMIVWLDAYTAGLTNGEGTIEVPSFG